MTAHPNRGQKTKEERAQAILDALKQRTTYSSGFTFRLPKRGWFAVWESTDLIEGPFPTEEEAASCFLDQRVRS